MDLNKLTLLDAIKGIKEKKFSSTEIVQDCLSQIEKLEPTLNAFVTIDKENVLEKSKKVDFDLPLAGIPIAIKDNFCTKGIKTTASSNLLRNYTAQYTATVVEKLENAGAIIIGKTNMDAWAHGSSTETSDFGSTNNPWNPKHLPGGSSGGSTAAVASDEVITSIGSETAGSIRQPSAWCGVVGLKPTYGRVSRYGVIAMASSMDCLLKTKTVDDAALLLSIISGHDPKDATSINQTSWITPKSLKDLKGLKIGVPKAYFPSNIKPEVKNSVLNAITILKKLGAEIIDLDVLDPKYSIAVYTVIQRSEVSSNLGRYTGIRYGKTRSAFGDEAIRRIMLGTYTLSSGYYDDYYLQAQKVRTLIIEDFNKQFQKVDAIIGPTSPTTALLIGASEGQSMFGELEDMLVEPSTLAGLPGISIPCGFNNGLPIGLQIITPQLREDIAINIARLFESNTDYHLQKPKL